MSDIQEITEAPAPMTATNGEAKLNDEGSGNEADFDGGQVKVNGTSENHGGERKVSGDETPEEGNGEVNSVDGDSGEVGELEEGSSVSENAAKEPGSEDSSGVDVVDRAVVSSCSNSSGDMPADSELSAVLSRRCDINDALEQGKDVKPVKKVFNVYTEFTEFSMKEIKGFVNTFKKWDMDKDGFLNLLELKRMMEHLGAPQTHLGLKQMIKDGGNHEKEGAISFKEFMFVLRKAKAGELEEGCGLNDLARLTEIDVEEVGVGGAKTFFEAKIKEQSVSSKFEAEVKADQEEKKRQAEEQKKRRAAFKDKANFFEKGVAAPDATNEM